MSFAEVLEELLTLSAQLGQLLIRRAVELDEPPMGKADESIVGSRLAAYRRDAASSVPLDQFRARIRRNRTQ